MDTQPDNSSDNGIPGWLATFSRDWNTDWSKRTIEIDELDGGGPNRDGIPSIDDPTFISSSDATSWLSENEPVIYVKIDDDVRAYPLQILMFHEIVNDVVGGTPIAVTYCPLCNSAVVFEARMDDQTLEFGTSGLLRNSDLVMYDRTTESLFQQATGEAIVGEYTGRNLKFLPASIVNFGEFRQAFPSGVVLDRPMGLYSRYGMNPYEGYDSRSPFLFNGEADNRLPTMARVIGMNGDNGAVAYPYAELETSGVVYDSPFGDEVVLFHAWGTASAVDAGIISEGNDVGSTGVFDPVYNGNRLTFERVDNLFIDNETGSIWNVLGVAIDGPMKDENASLTPLVHVDHFWFAWAAFYPDTTIYEN